MSSIIVDFSCGGTALHRKKIQFKLNPATSEVYDWVIYEGPIGLDGMFFHLALKKTVPKSISEISAHVPGIKQKLSHKFNITKPNFIF